MGDTKAGTTAKYDDFCSYVKATYSLREAVVARWAVSEYGPYPRRVRELMRTPLALKSSPAATRLMGISTTTEPLSPAEQAGLLAVATKDEEDLPEFVHVISTYWIEDLAAACCSKFGLDAPTVAAFTQIDGMRIAPTPWERLTSPQRALAFATGALGLVAAVLTKDSFETLKWDVSIYGYLTVISAAAILVIAGYLAVLGLVARRAEAHREGPAELIPIAIAFCAMKCEAADHAG
jgi:hypothetical protein